MDGTKNVDSVTDNGGTSCLPLWSRSSIDRTRPSGSFVGMVQASPNIKGHTDNPENGSTGFPLPVYSSSSAGGDDAVASTSRAGMVEESGALGKEASCRNATGTRGRELQELCGASGNVPSERNALHGYPIEHTGDTANIYKASDESSAKQSNFAEHCRKRSREDHKCESCGKLFPWGSLLVRHYRTHTDERPYSCEICDKSFRRSDHLDVHKRMHTDERPYKCEICDTSFSDPSTFCRHQLTHTDERPHVCHKCTKAFKIKQALKRHLNLHCRYRAFVCDACNLFFMDKSGLSHHRQSMHRDKSTV
nr:zinc finger protein 479-like isoform X1 [Dermacentor andersoni]